MGSSFDEGGNGDTLLQTAQAALPEGTESTIIHLRDKKFGFCHGCYGCAKDGVCVQRDDFAGILKLIHEADAIIVAGPVYYNHIDGLLKTAIDRLCCTFACRSYQIGPKKRVAFMLTCTGSTVEDMNRNVELITTLPSLSRAISESRTEVFNGCGKKDTCANSKEYLERAAEVGRWAGGDTIQ